MTTDLPTDRQRPERTQRRIRVVARAVTSSLLVLTVIAFAPDLRDGVRWLVPSAVPTPNGPAPRGNVDREVTRMRRELASLVPRGAFLVVSSTDNSFTLQTREGILREGLCSTGNYVQLKGHEGQEWLFETPKGSFRVLEKRTNPVWTKPDWAFVEAGEPIPPPGSAARVERGVLGDYALSLGDGYLIHGTLYQRLLGTPVTHGCVRLGDDDLEAVFRALPIGGRVYIY